MPTVDELLEQDEDIGSEYDGFTKDERYKTIEYSDYQIVQISNKTIGNYSQQISSQGEINRQYIVFEHERYMDGIDLADKLIQIHYELPDGFKNNSEVVNVQYSDSIIQFGWLITERIARNSGTVMFMPFFYGNAPDGELYLLKDLFAQYSIRGNLGIDDGIVEPVEESWYQQFLDNIIALQNYTNDAEQSASKAKQSENQAKNYMEQARQLSITSVGDMTFFINADKNCLSVTYTE